MKNQKFQTFEVLSEIVLNELNVPFNFSVTGSKFRSIPARGKQRGVKRQSQDRVKAPYRKTARGKRRVKHPQSQAPFTKPAIK